MRGSLTKTIWGQIDPYAGVDFMSRDLQGWRSGHILLTGAVRDKRLLCEVGVWKGAGIVDMALDNNAQILAVDTFRGSFEHWAQERWSRETHGGILFNQFLSNMLSVKLDGRVTPLPLDSVNAAALCAYHEIHFDVVHIDAGHDLASVTQDLVCWSPLADVIIMDDYCPDFPEVIEAVDNFCDATSWAIVSAVDGKAQLVEEDEAGG